MTFCEWMGIKYRDKNTLAGELAAYLRHIDGARFSSTYDEFLPLLDSLNAPWNARRVFQLCWHHYHEDQFWLEDFLNDCCTVCTGAVEESGKLLNAYCDYSHQPGKYTHSAKDFYGRLAALGFTRYRTNKGSFVRGVILKDA